VLHGEDLDSLCHRIAPFLSGDPWVGGTRLGDAKGRVAGGYAGIGRTPDSRAQQRELERSG